MTARDHDIDPFGNDAGDEHRAAYCDGCGATHYPGEHRQLTAPELATLRAAAAQSSFGVPYTDTYLIDRAIVARGILTNADNRRAYREHVDTLAGMGMLEFVEPNAPALGVTGTPVDVTTEALQYLTELDRSTR